MKTKLTVDKPIDPYLSKKILTSLDSACLEAARKVGREMGFSINQHFFQIDPLPDPVTGIEFSFNVTLVKD